MSVKRTVSPDPNPPKPAVEVEHRTSGFRASTPLAGPRVLMVFRDAIYRDVDGNVVEAPADMPTGYEYPIEVNAEFVAKYPEAVSVMNSLATIFDMEDPKLAAPPT